MADMEVFTLTDTDGRLLHPVVQAATLAKYSRSVDSARELLRKTTEAKAEAFHQKWLVDFGHNCFDADTEVLTENGFVPWPDIQGTEKLATLAPDTDKIEYLQPVRIIRDRYVGPMYRVKAQRVDLLVTPNHRMWVWYKKTARQRANPVYDLVAASELKGQPVAYRLNGGVWEGPEPATIAVGDFDVDSYALMQLLGFFIGDGYQDSKTASSISFRMRKRRKIEYLERLCAECGFSLAAHKNDKYYVSGKNIGLFFRDCYTSSKEKHIPARFLQLGSGLLRALWAGLIESDGSIGKQGSLTYFTSSRVLVDQLVELAFKLGYSAYPTNHRPGLTVICINQTKNRPEVNKVSYRIQDAWVPYSGTVYCAEMPRNHTLYVRRNGRCVWSGNSVAELATIPLCFEGVSIVASKILESWARPGCCEKSTRIVPFTIDAMHWPSDGLKQRYEPLVQDLFDAYTHIWRTLSAEGKQPEGDVRATGAALDVARCLLPAGVKTNLALVANLRDFSAMIRALSAHPLDELRTIARAMKTALEPLGGPLVRHAEPMPWLNNWIPRYDNAAELPRGGRPGVYWFRRLGADQDLLARVSQTYNLGEPEFEYVMSMRPYKQEVPDVFRYLRVQADILVDYGSFRDLQRHRRLNQFPEPLTVQYGYTVPDALLGTELEKLYRKVVDSFQSVPIAFPTQYVLPMAYIHRNRIDMDLQELYYIAELRTQPGGHITYRRIAWQLAQLARQCFPYSMQWCRAIDPDAGGQGADNDATIISRKT